MRTIRRTTQFKKDFKRALKRGCDPNRFQLVIEALLSGGKLDPWHRDHSLGAGYKDCRECHIAPDWLLIYQLSSDELTLIRTGSHSDLFE